MRKLWNYNFFLVILLTLGLKNSYSQNAIFTKRYESATNRTISLSDSSSIIEIKSDRIVPQNLDSLGRTYVVFGFDDLKSNLADTGEYKIVFLIKRSLDGASYLNPEYAELTINKTINASTITMEGTMVMEDAQILIIELEEIIKNGQQISELPVGFYIESQIEHEDQLAPRVSYNDRIETYGTLLHTDCDPDEKIDFLRISWRVPYIEGRLSYPDFFQLEWVWYDNYIYEQSTNTLDNIQSPNELFSAIGPIDFRHGSTRVSTVNSYYDIPMFFNKGFIFYRVRVGYENNGIQLSSIFGPWSLPNMLGNDGNSPGDDIKAGDYDLTNSFTLIPLPLAINAAPEVSNYFLNKQEFDRNKNWNAEMTYAEEGKHKEIMKFYDGTMRERQTIAGMSTDITSYGNSIGYVVIGQKYYDYHGRPAIEILPTPISAEGCPVDVTHPGFQYRKYFNIPEGTASTPPSTEFEYSLFDSKPDFTTGNYTHTIQLDIDQGTSRYYSSNVLVPGTTGASENSFFDAPWMNMIPDANKFPLSQTIYEPDPEGKVIYKGGVGEQLQTPNGADLGHATRNFYAQPGQGDLDMIFGSESGNASRYEKEITKDPNTQVSFNYKDANGKTVATSMLVGSSVVNNYLPIDEETAVGSNPNTIYQTGPASGAIISSNGNVIDFSRNFFIPADNFAGKYSYKYELDELKIDCSDPAANVCLNCYYFLDIEIKDEFGNLMASNHQGVWKKFDPSTASYVNCTDCPSPASNTYAMMPRNLAIGFAPTPITNAIPNATSYSIDCPGYNAENLEFEVCFPKQGVYTITKKLRLDVQAYEAYKNYYLNDLLANCIEPDTPDNVSGNVNVSLDCGEIDCEACVAALGTRADWIADGKDPEVYDLSVEACREPCSEDGWCETIYLQLLSDVSPNGQYGEIGGLRKGNLSVFNTINMLPLNNSNFGQPCFNYGQTGNWRNPGTQVNGVGYYLDEDGSISRIYFSDINSPIYQTGATPNWDPDRNQYWINPKDFSSTIYFLQFWKPSWAKALVHLHPEYKYYEACLQFSRPLNNTINISSDNFDEKLKLANTWHQAYLLNLVDIDSTSVQGTMNVINNWMDSSSDMFDPFIVSTTSNNIYDGFLPINLPSTVNPNLDIFRSMYEKMESVLKCAEGPLANQAFPNYLTGATPNTSEILARIACMVRYNGDPALYLAADPNRRMFGSDFYVGTTGNPILQLQIDENNRIKNDEWIMLKSLYLGAKLQIQEEFMDLHTTFNTYGYNYCIGNTKQDPVEVGFLYSPNVYSNTSNASPFSFGTSFLTTYFGNIPDNKACQPCSRWNKIMYANKIRRFAFASSLPQITVQEADYFTYMQTGLCPLAVDMSLMLDYLATHKTVISSTEIPAINVNYDDVVQNDVTYHYNNLQNVAAMSQELYTAIIPPGSTSYIPMKWGLKDPANSATNSCPYDKFKISDFPASPTSQPSFSKNVYVQNCDLPSALLSANTSLPSSIFLSTLPSNLEITGLTTFSILQSNSITPSSCQPTGGTWFNLSFKIKDVSTNVEAICEFKAWTDILINTCAGDMANFVQCKPNHIGDELIDLVEVLANAGLFSKITPPVNLASVSMGPSINNLPGPSMRAHLGTLTTYPVSFSTNATQWYDFKVFIQGTSHDLKINLSNYTTTWNSNTTNPMTVTRVIPLNSAGGIKVTFKDASLTDSTVVEFSLTKVENANLTNTLLEITECEPPTPLHCRASVFEVQHDLETFVSKFLLGNTGVNLSNLSATATINNFDADITALFKTYLPNNYDAPNTEITKLYDNTTEQNTISIMFQDDPNIPPADQIPCELILYQRNNINGISPNNTPNGFHFFDQAIQLISSNKMMPYGDVGPDGNFHKFYLILKSESPQGGIFYTDTVFGEICFGFNFCLPCAGATINTNGDYLTLDNDPCNPLPPPSLAYITGDELDCDDESNSVNAFNASIINQQFEAYFAAEFDRVYKDHCMALKETLIFESEVTENIYTLYYYDQAGNLIKTVPPQGVEKLDAQGQTDSHTSYKVPEHRMATEYKYNSLNQLVAQGMPDQDKINLTQWSNSNGLPTNFVPTDVEFMSSGTGYVTGYYTGTGAGKGALYKTQDGGLNWVQQDLMGGSAFNDMLLINGKGYAVGNDGLMFKSEDNGLTWRMIPVAPAMTQNLNACYFIDEYNGIVVGNQGALYKYQESGANISLTEITPPTGISISGMNFIEAGHVVIGTQDHYICFASNPVTSAGINSREDNFSVLINAVGTTSVVFDNFSLNGINAISDNASNATFDHTIAGDNGLIANYIDNGATNAGSWFIQKSPFQFQVNAASFINQNTGVVLAEDENNLRTLYGTTDGGTTWTSLTPNVYINNINFNQNSAGNISGFACGPDGAIYKITQTTLGAINVHQISFSDPAMGLIQGALSDGNSAYVLAIDGSIHFCADITQTTASQGAYNANSLISMYTSFPIWAPLSSSSGLVQITGVINKFTVVNNSATPGERYLLFSTSGIGVSTLSVYTHQTSTGLLSNSPFTTSALDFTTANLSGSQYALILTTPNSNIFDIDKLLLGTSTVSSVATNLSFSGTQGINTSTGTKIWYSKDKIFISNGSGELLESNSYTGGSAPTFNPGGDKLIPAPIKTFGAFEISTTADAGLGFDKQGHLYAFNFASTSSAAKLNLSFKEKVNSMALVQNANNVYAVCAGSNSFAKEIMLTISGQSYTVTEGSIDILNSNEELVSTAIAYASNTLRCALGSNSGKIYPFTKISTLWIGTNQIQLTSGAVKSMVFNFLNASTYSIISSSQNGQINKVTPILNSLLSPVFTTPLHTLSIAANHSIFVGGEQGFMKYSLDQTNWISAGQAYTGTTPAFAKVSTSTAKGNSEFCAAGTNGFIQVITPGQTITACSPSSSNNYVKLASNNNTLYTLNSNGIVGQVLLADVCSSLPAAITGLTGVDDIVYFNDLLYFTSSNTLHTYNGTTISNVTPTTGNVNNTDLKRLVLSPNGSVWAYGNTSNASTYTSIMVVYPTTVTAIDLVNLIGTASNLQLINFSDPSNLFVYTDNKPYKLYFELGKFSTYFFYDKLGRMILSQNAKQSANKAYTYTIYDDLGRIIEVGQKIDNTSYPISNIYGDMIGGIYNENVINPIKFKSWLTNANGDRTEVTHTFYKEDPNFDFIANYQIPNVNTDHPTPSYRNYRGRILVSAFYNEVLPGQNWRNYEHASHYSYDIHGNVSALWQEINNQPLIPSDQRIKAINYKYDLVSGKVNEVGYMSYYPDQFKHTYNYDADNRITEVQTTRDYVNYERDAAYFYYPHGPLARTELGENNVQGIDNYYTLQGWMKGVNGYNNSITTDPLQDGNPSSPYPTSNFGQDVFSYNLGYFNGDFTPVNGSNPTLDFNQSALIPSTSYTPPPLPPTPITISGYAELFNGNITAMVNTINIGTTGSPVAQNLVSYYRYDRLSRLKFALNGEAVDDNSQPANQSLANSKFNTEYKYDFNGNIISQNKEDNGGTLIDELSYNYGTGPRVHNRLMEVDNNLTGTTSYPTNNAFEYDGSGNLIEESAEGLTMEWTNSGKLKRVTKTGTGAYTLYFTYDAMGNRVTKEHVMNGDTVLTYYVRDAQGNVMATYKTDEGVTAPYQLKELVLYGSSRLGVVNVDEPIVNPVGPVRSDPPVNSTFYSTTGKKQYELTNHLGNVLSTINDNAQLLSSNDYYPFGSPMPNRNFSSGEYRYGFNGKEEDGEIKGEGNSLDFGARIYDSRLGRWMSTDPLQDKYPSHSPYNFCANSPILFVDVDGNKFISYINVKQKNETTGKIEKVSYKVVFDGTVTTMQQVVNGKVTGEAIAYNTGTNKFVDDMVTSYNYIVKNGADIDNAMQKIAEMDTEFEVKDRPGKGEYVDGVIKYDFDNGVKVKSKDKTVEGIQSPALGFWSEVYHAYIDKVDLTKKDEFARNPNPLDALAAEETYVHIEKEGQVIDALKKADNTNNEPKRKSYQDGWKNVKTKGPTSTEKK